MVMVADPLVELSREAKAYRYCLVPVSQVIVNVSTRVVLAESEYIFKVAVLPALSKVNQCGPMVVPATL
jgi:hypothetical protein